MMMMILDVLFFVMHIRIGFLPVFIFFFLFIIVALFTFTLMESQWDEFIPHLRILSRHLMLGHSRATSTRRSVRFSSRRFRIISRSTRVDRWDSCSRRSTRSRLAIPVSPDNMRKLASLVVTSTLLCEIRTFPDMRLLTVKSLRTISQHSEITTNAVSLANTDMRERTVLPGTATVIGKMNAERGTLRGGIMWEVASFSIVGTIALKEVPADGYLGWVVLIHAS